MEKTKTNNSESKNEEYVTLNSGYKMPLCGLGTYAGENLDKLIYDSIKSGIRLIDTARYYENEEAIGKGIKKALDDKIVERKDLFIITKIWSTDYGKIEETIKTQLKDLQVDYVDLYLAHWPINIIYSEKDGKKDVTFYSWHKLWPQFESLVDNGYAKSIGISNFNVQLISDILSYARIKPAVNEFELNPYLPQIGLVDFCNKYDIKIIAYNSLVLGGLPKNDDNIESYKLLEEDIIKQMSKKYNKSEAQIVLNWSVSQGIAVIPKSSNLERIKSNYECVSFRMDKDDVEAITNKLKVKNKRFFEGSFDINNYVSNFA